jgi:hypothetical protein
VIAMNSVLIAALIKGQAPKHTGHVENRPAEFIEYDGTDKKVTVQCSCNVRLTLNVEAPKEKQHKPAANKVVGDGA